MRTTRTNLRYIPLCGRRGTEEKIPQSDRWYAIEEYQAANEKCLAKLGRPADEISAAEKESRGPSERWTKPAGHWPTPFKSAVYFPHPSIAVSAWEITRYHSCVSATFRMREMRHMFLREQQRLAPDRTKQSRRTIMKTLVSAFLALSVLTGIAASASAFDPKSFYEQQDREHGN